jgi:hypothetical protein
MKQIMIRVHGSLAKQLGLNGEDIHVWHLLRLMHFRTSSNMISSEVLGSRASTNIFISKLLLVEYPSI